MQQFFADMRPWAELGYFASAVVLAVVAIFGLQQVSLVKRDILLRSDRAAKEKAIEYSHRYLTIFVALHDKCWKDQLQKGFAGYRGPIGDFTAESLPRADRMTVLKKVAAIADSWLPAFNELQSISSAFIVGVADERVGFEIIGRTFCHSVGANYDILATVREDKPCPYYQNIVALYRLWSARMTKAELSAASEDLILRIHRIPDAEIPPIGLGD